MTAKSADPLVVRPQPTHDDAAPNANGVFAEALVRLAQITETGESHRQASDTLSRLVGVARAAPLGHTSILNALDLHLRGVSILITGQGGGGALRCRLAGPLFRPQRPMAEAWRGAGRQPPGQGPHGIGARPAGPGLRRHALLFTGDGSGCLESSGAGHDGVWGSLKGLLDARCRTRRRRLIGHLRPLPPASDA
jgi:hypothetical protein